MAVTSSRLRTTSPPTWPTRHGEADLTQAWRGQRSYDRPNTGKVGKVDVTQWQARASSQGPRTTWIQTQGEEASNRQLHENLNLLEEKRTDAHLRTLAYRRDVTKLYNRRVRPRLVKIGDLVLWKAEVSDPTRSRGKLAPNWEGPYRVVEVVREGTYTGNNGGASATENLAHF
ncbi:hypothetical protein B296_00038312 [Ensete ventricosum]|uniref:Uncharacterized protein n=1 Tax=Ensete ventricosum TaxID=4639 RepID=A0A426Z4F8_ENSVE|nr:hypothetical protein B296_00038312 [Ensete ventricosum]